MGKLYKFFSPELIHRIFPAEKQQVHLKCSYPKDYNDPYELFLTIDPQKIRGDALAYYLEVIKDIQQIPTTCFSRTPCSMPLWAHYAKDSTGFAIEFDEDSLLEKVKNKIALRDIEYKGTNNFINPQILEMACYRCKPRDQYFLEAHVYSLAYFTKNSAWSYEQECRLSVNDPSLLIKAENIMLLPIDIDCISSIILGTRISSQDVDTLVNICNNKFLEYYQLKIAKSSFMPFFTDSHNRSMQYKDGNIAFSLHSCEQCGEPLLEDREDNLCPWCSISDWQRQEARSRDPFRILNDVDMLSEYISGMNSISSKEDE